ncbi:outer membrane beta-barrel protein [Sulfurimonas sp.]|uniref:outer membrane beta-barrel protein n=1 Tax=Sulfurimonas sp. TaxID=2022749 RepID=UPI0026389209|nr:outer membrane beta-barrel protein [Sulfurimonas sp.]
MIKNKLIGAVALCAFLTTSAIAENDLSAKDFSLIGIEGSYASVSSDIDTATTYQSDRKNLTGIGLKVGAQSYNYRIFLTANYYNDPDGDFEYITTYGAQLDYLLNISQRVNIYLGVNAGYANMKYTVPSEGFKRTISDPYYGGDAGLNIHVSKLIDFELGARMILLDAVNTKNNVTYTFNNMVTGYASIIFKYQMD